MSFARQIYAELAALPILCADCRITVPRPFPAEVLPASALRGLIGSHLYKMGEEDPAASPAVAIFKRDADGHAPAAYAFQSPLMPPGTTRIPFRIVTWDREGILLEALLAAARRAVGKSDGTRYPMADFEHDPIQRGEYDPDAPLLPARGRFLLAIESPWVAKPRSGGTGSRHLADPARTGLADLVAASLLRLSNLSASDGSGRFDWRAFPTSEIASGCSWSASSFRTVEARCLDRGFPLLDGLVGHAEFACPSPDLLAAMAATSILGIGKNTAEGCGSTRLTSFDP